MTSARTHELRKAATLAGLHYVTDGLAGIRRRRSGKGWVYYAPNGSRIRDPDTRKRLNALAIPPAWTDVWICPDAVGHIQATARDARGRKQYRYHPLYRAARDKSKFRRMLEFSEILPDIRERVERDLRAGDLTRRQILATVVRLLGGHDAGGQSALRRGAGEDAAGGGAEHPPRHRRGGRSPRQYPRGVQEILRPSGTGERVSRGTHRDPPLGDRAAPAQESCVGR